MYNINYVVFFFYGQLLKLNGKKREQRMCLSLGKRMHLRARKNRSRQTKRRYHSSSRGSHPRTSRKTPGVKEKQRRTGCAGSERGSAAEGEGEAEARQGRRVAGAVGGPGLWAREKARAGGDQGG